MILIEQPRRAQRFDQAAACAFTKIMYKKLNETLSYPQDWQLSNGF